MTAANQINHVEYPKQLKSKTVAQLHYIIKDCKETLEVNPDGHKAGYYADEINYCCNELQRRKSLASACSACGGYTNVGGMSHKADCSC